ncbi:acylneuraminate cytidylyltransferase family protein [Dyadobacter sp. CY261]|uniref:acylneuraminate cytidylyltransferase family protein n=1 Tax=Dyadobacter sp. CY261 TaxID=2907203 RepID=UPI001F34CCE1|nr:acylneuraminate cytidylyltransferase family protein [Dyadobacter sp. CY261]MCF0071409.1 acylneuraminate cytidylyltransferase family protein [Dyadobacter sp. CY261]
MTKPFPKILGLIPARAGSKGVSNKNMRLLGSEPLIRYTIEAARQSDLLDKVIVSTDSPETADFSNRFDGTSAFFLRPPHLATDHSPMIDVIVHAIDYAETEWGKFKYVVLLQPTCPFRAIDIIDKAIRQIICEDADSLISVRKIPHMFHPFWAYTYADKSLVKALPDVNRSIITRRQDLPDTYFRDGEIYIARTSLIRAGQITGGSISPWINENSFGINIDTPADWARAENLLQAWKDHTSLVSWC